MTTMWSTTKTAANILYFQTLHDIEKGLIQANKETRRQLTALQAKGSKKEVFQPFLKFFLMTTLFLNSTCNCRELSNTTDIFNSSHVFVIIPNQTLVYWSPPAAKNSISGLTPHLLVKYQSKNPLLISSFTKGTNERIQFPSDSNPLLETNHFIARQTKWLCAQYKSKHWQQQFSNKWSNKYPIRAFVWISH